ncbi:hypothetical protein HWV62_25100 [Athelia sp. TMB]|nr:hypothetical protein HWV62_25100 [Athelia sp. TMB]
MPIPNITSETACTCQTVRLAKPLDGLQLSVTELLETFAAPSPAECSVIRERIGHIAADMTILDAEIERVEDILARLRHNRAVLRQRSNGHHNALNLTRRLPVEILGEIFILCQETSASGRSIAPTHICRQWRAVALATSKLWNNLKITMKSKERADAEMTPLWLQRSGGQPLTIELGNPDRQSSWWGDMDIEQADIFTKVNSHAQRWGDVTMHLTQSMLALLRSFPEDLPILHTLHLNGPEHRSELPSSLTNFQIAPALRNLTLQRRVASALPEIPWAQLTTCTLLQGGGYTCQDSYFVLSKAVNLESFGIRIIATSTFAQVPPPIRHGNLLSMDIVVLLGMMAQDFFNLLTLPALTKIHFRGVASDGSTTYLRSLITRSGCSLRQLALDFGWGHGYTLDNLTNLLEVMPTLSEFEALGTVEATVLELLTHHPSRDVCLLPQLTGVKLSFAANHLIGNCERVAIFLASRRPAAGSDPQDAGIALIRSVVLSVDKVNGEKRMPSDTYNQFISLRDGGLDFVIFDEESRQCSLEDCFVPGEEKEQSGCGFGMLEYEEVTDEEMDADEEETDEDEDEMDEDEEETDEDDEETHSSDISEMWQ